MPMLAPATRFCTHIYTHVAQVCMMIHRAAIAGDATALERALQVTQVHVYANIYTHAHTHVYTQVYVHVHMNVCTVSSMHTCAHVQIHACPCM